MLYSVWRYSLPWPDQNANGCKNVEIRGCSTSIEVFDLASHNIQATDSFWSNDWVLQVVLGGNSIILRLSTLGWASQLFMIRATFLPSAWNFMLSFSHLIKKDFPPAHLLDGRFLLEDVDKTNQTPQRCKYPIIHFMRGSWAIESALNLLSFQLCMILHCQKQFAVLYYACFSIYLAILLKPWNLLCQVLLRNLKFSEYLCIHQMVYLVHVHS